MCVGKCVCTTKMPDHNDLKFGTVEVLVTMSQIIDFGFKRARVSV